MYFKKHYVLLNRALIMGNIILLIDNAISFLTISGYPEFIKMFIILVRTKVFI